MVGAIIGGIASAIAGGVKIAGSVVVAGVKVVGQVASSGIKVISSGANAVTSGVSTAVAGAIKVGKAAFSKDKSRGSSNNGGSSESFNGAGGGGQGSSGAQSQKLGPRAEAVRLIREKQELKKQQAREEFGYGGSGQQADDARDSADLAKEDDRAEKMRVLQEMKAKRTETEKKVAEVSKQRDADLATSVKKHQESSTAILEMKAKTARMEAETATLQAQTANIVASSRATGAGAGAGGVEGQDAAAKKAELSKRIAQMRAAQAKKAENVSQPERASQPERVSSEFNEREATQKNQNLGNSARTREATANTAEVSREFSDVPRRSGGRVSKPTNFGASAEETSVFG